MAALEALFTDFPTERLAPVAPEHTFPTEMDSAIEADAAIQWEFESFRWYSGVDVHGIRRFFRFKRGLSLEQWHQLLQTQRLCSVEGPFRTLNQAQNKVSAEPA